MTSLFSFLNDLFIPNRGGEFFSALSSLKRVFFSFFILLLIFFPFAGCSKRPVPSKQVSVLVTVAPIAGLVKDVAGDSVPVTILVPAGKEPETFMPTPSEMMEITQCTIFFRVGLPSEEAVADRLKSINPDLLIVDLRDNLPILNIDVGIPEGNNDDPQNLTEIEHYQEEDHHHHHGEGDPHIWMSLDNLDKMAETVCCTLSEADPVNQELFKTNRELFHHKVVNLQQEIIEELSGITLRTIYVFHPAYGWYCHEFGFKQRAVESGGKSPKAKDLVDLIRILEEEKAEKIFVQPEFSRSAADKIAESLHIQVEVHSPLEEDPLKNIRELTEAIVR